MFSVILLIITIACTVISISCLILLIKNGNREDFLVGLLCQMLAVSAWTSFCKLQPPPTEVISSYVIVESPLNTEALSKANVLLL